MSPGAGLYVYPRLPDSAARALVIRIQDVDSSTLAGWGALLHAEAAPNPTGGRPAPKSKIEDVQAIVRNLALDFGFPSRMSVSKQAEFDRICGTLLYKEMNIVPADAGHKQVWSFLTLVVLPEIAPWRFRAPSEERLLGGVRNTFQRLWWRAWALGPDLTEIPVGALALGEDEYVQIMERPTLAGNQRVAHAIQTAIWSVNASSTGIQRATLLRSLLIRVLAARAHLSLDGLGDDQLAALVRKLRDEAVTAMKAAAPNS